MQTPDYIENTIPDLVFIVNRDGIVKKYHFQDDGSGLLAAEIQGKHLYDILPEDTANFHLSKLHEALESNLPLNYCYEVPLLGGTTQYFETSVCKCAENEGIFIIRDITVRRLEEIRIAKLAEELERFVYITTHDIKAPLLNIEGHFDLIRHAIDQEDQDIQDSVGWIDKSIEKAKRILQEQIQFAPLNQQLDTAPQSLNFRAIIEDVLEAFSQQIQTSACSIELDLKAENITLYKPHLRSILSNLFGNAFKYRSTKRQLSIRLSSWEEDDWTCFKIEDNGVGFDMQSHSHTIFDIFTRAHEHTEGSGIGLYLISKMIEHAGGRIEVSSQVNQGSTFTITVPKLLVEG